MALKTIFSYEQAAGYPVVCDMIVPTGKVFEAIELTKQYANRLIGVPEDAISVSRVIEGDKCLWACSKEELKKDLP